MPRSQELISVLYKDAPRFALGEKPIVQDYVYTLLKRRLRAEIERRPPLFPWENEVCDYPIEDPQWAESPSLSLSPWAAQFEAFRWPTALPETVLTTLFERCQSVAQKALKPGVKLVQAVEDLFPNQPQALNHFAGMVLVSPARSGRATTLADAPTEQNLPASYEQATPAQQMMLSLLAARDILQTLTLEVSAAQPQQVREWQTSAGLLRLAIAYHPQSAQIQVSAELPCGGQLRLQSDETEMEAQSFEAGYLALTLPHPVLNQTYRLAVELADFDQPPLQFAMVLVDEADERAG